MLPLPSRACAPSPRLACVVNVERKKNHNPSSRNDLVHCHHLVLSFPSLSTLLPTCCLHPNVSSSARPLKRKHGPLTLLDPRARRDQRGHTPGAYAGVGPADYERDSAEEEPCSRRTRIGEAGDAVPGSQDSITRGIRNLQIADIPAAQPDGVDRPSVTMTNPRRPTQQRPRRQRAYLRCAQCGADPHAHI